MGEYFAALLVGHCGIVELNACRALADEHIAQLFGHLCVYRLEHGLLINFGAPDLGLKKYVLSAAE